MARTSGAPRCPLCGAEMREELGMGRENAGMVQRWWTCPQCLHRETTVEEVRGAGGAGAVPAPEAKKEVAWKTR